MDAEAPFIHIASSEAAFLDFQCALFFVLSSFSMCVGQVERKEMGGTMHGHIELNVSLIMCVTQIRIRDKIVPTAMHVHCLCGMLKRWR